MQVLANFIGELGGDTWTTQAVAVVIQSAAIVLAALLALSAAIVTGLWASNEANKNRIQAAQDADDNRAAAAKQAQMDREQALEIVAAGERERQNRQGRLDWWVQFSWAAERLQSENEKSGVLAAAILSRLEVVDWASREDKELVKQVLASLRSDITAEDVRRMRLGKNNKG